MIAFTTQNGFRDQQNQDQGIGTASPLSLVYSSDPTAPVKNPDVHTTPTQTGVPLPIRI